MSNNRNPYMNQNLSQNQRNMNMRGGYGFQGPMQGQRSAQNDCGCAGNAGQTPANTCAQRSVQNDCGCAGNAGPVPANTSAQRSAQGGCCGQVNPAAQSDCGCSGNAGYSPVAEIPAGDRPSLLRYINEVSFGAYEATLYLDTHPDCQNGMQYFRELNEKRNFALKEYAKLYGPLTLAQADESCDAYWQWVNQPWPWEGGNC